MGKRGPAKKPTSQLAGEWRKKQRAAREPQATDERPECPSWANEYVQQRWEAWCDFLTARGTITAADGKALAAMITAEFNWLAAEAAVCADGYTLRYFGRHGEVVKTNPAVADRTKWHTIYKQWLQQFGLTPACRSDAPVLKTAQEASDLFSGLRVV